MEKIVINSTEGGAFIKGCLHIPLKDSIDKYCTSPIDKSKLKELCATPAEDGDELIKEVIPRLQQDIDNLSAIIRHSRIGIAISTTIRKLIEKWSKEYSQLITNKIEKRFNTLYTKVNQENKYDFSKTNNVFFKEMIKEVERLINCSSGATKEKRKKLFIILKLSDRNFFHSEKAHVYSMLNPLVNVAIYGASRQIQSRELKGKETFADFIKNKQNALIRLERNSVILNAAKNAAESLKKSYKKTLKLLKKYQKTGDLTLLNPCKKEKVNLKDAEKYFKVGNWGHPLLDCEKIIDNPYNPKITEIWNKALEMRENAIEQAKLREEKHLDYERKLLQYNKLIEDGTTQGRDHQNFNEALKLLKQANELLPNEIGAKWGLASAYFQLKQYDESIKWYKEILEDHPDNYKFKFEYGTTLLLADKTEEALKIIGEIMKETNQFDYFLIRIAAICEKAGMYKEAETAYKEYLDKFPFDDNGWYQYGNFLMYQNRNNEAEKAFQKAKEINPSDHEKKNEKNT